MIELKNISKVFDKNVVAIEDLNLTVEDKEFVALLGPSGCGKTTTLMMLAGLYKPTGGEILFYGKNVTRLEPKDRNIGMVFQSYALYPNMNVRDNIAFPLKQKKVPKEQRYAKAEEMARLVQIEHLLDRKTSQLSGGQQQRVAMCRALSKDPQLLLLDEPMSNLDTRLKIDVRDEIRKIQQRMGITAVIVTHDQEEAMAIADKIAILDNGKIQQYGTPSQLYNQPANLFVAQFMGSPPMNFMEGVLRRRADGSYLVESPFLRIPVAAQELEQPPEDGLPVVVGVRPHDMFLAQENPHVTGKVQLSEHLGRELLVKADVGSESIRIMVPTEQAHFLGETLQCVLKEGHLKLFHRQSGVRISK